MKLWIDASSQDNKGGERIFDVMSHTSKRGCPKSLHALVKRDVKRDAKSKDDAYFSFTPLLSLFLTLAHNLIVML